MVEYSQEALAEVGAVVHQMNQDVLTDISTLSKFNLTTFELQLATWKIHAVALRKCLRARDEILQRRGIQGTMNLDKALQELDK